MNYVNSTNAVKPRYDVTNKPVSVHFYINNEKQLLLVGYIDNNYICYLAKTRLNDVRTNAVIFDEIVNDKKETVTFLVKALKEINMKPEELNSWVKGEVNPSINPRIAFTSSMNINYQNKLAGKYFSRDLIEYYTTLKTQATLKSADGLYYPVLEKYFELLQKSTYSEVKPLIELLDKEKCLLFAEDEAIKTIYQKIVNQSLRLYNSTVTKEH